MADSPIVHDSIKVFEYPRCCAFHPEVIQYQQGHVAEEVETGIIRCVALSGKPPPQFVQHQRDIPVVSIHTPARGATLLPGVNRPPDAVNVGCSHAQAMIHNVALRLAYLEPEVTTAPGTRVQAMSGPSGS